MKDWILSAEQLVKFAYNRNLRKVLIFHWQALNKAVIIMRRPCVTKDQNIAYLQNFWKKDACVNRYETDLQDTGLHVI